MAAWLPSGAAGWHRAQALSACWAGSTAGRRSSARTALADPRMARPRERHRHSCSVTSSHSVCPWPGGQPAAAGEHGGVPQKAMWPEADAVAANLLSWYSVGCGQQGSPGACRAHRDERGHLHGVGGCQNPQPLCPAVCAAAALHCSFMSHCGNRQSHTSLGLVPILIPAVCSWCQLAAGMSSQLVSALVQHSPRLAARGMALGVLSLRQALQPWVLRVL